jgi:hypothetical protein
VKNRDNYYQIVAAMLLTSLAGIVWLTWAALDTTVAFAQQPTVAIPTVTGTPQGPLATVPMDQTIVYVYTGPGPDYPVIGVLVAGQQVPARSVTRGGEWLEIVYLGVPENTGWVYRRLVIMTDELPVVTPPPTPTPRVTPTLNPTLAAEFLAKTPATPLLTFTAPPALILPTFAPETSAMDAVGLPMGFLIIGLAVVGIFGAMITLLRGR